MNENRLLIFVEVFPKNSFLGYFSEEYLAAAHLKKMPLQRLERMRLGNEIGEFLKRTNVTNFVVSFHVVILCSSPHCDAGTFP